MSNFAISTILYISGAACCDCANTNLIVVGHTAVGDDLSVLLHAAGRFDRRRAPLVVFTGNEYDILDDKIAFIRQTGAEFICTQLPLAAAQYLHGECAGSRIVEMPHALNPTH